MISDDDVSQEHVQPEASTTPDCVTPSSAHKFEWDNSSNTFEFNESHNRDPYTSSHIVGEVSKLPVRDTYSSEFTDHSFPSSLYFSRTTNNTESEYFPEQSEYDIDNSSDSSVFLDFDERDSSGNSNCTTVTMPATEAQKAKHRRA